MNDAEFEQCLRKRLFKMPDGSTFKLSEEWLKATKKKAKKEKVSYKTAIKFMLIKALELYGKGLTMDKFGYEIAKGKNDSMADCVKNIFYAYLRFTIMQDFGKEIGIEVVDVTEFMKKKKKLEVD